MSLRRDAVDFLRRPLLRQINFTLGSMTLRGIRYARIANAIDDGRVEVERSRDVHASAEYDYADWYDDRDRLHRGTLRFQPTFRFTRGEPSPRQLLRHALVVHVPGD